MSGAAPMRFWRPGSTTLLVGVDDADAPIVMQVFQENCQAAERLIRVILDLDVAVGR